MKSNDNLEKDNYDVVIIGAGPAGLFAAKRIAENSGLRILVVEKGMDVHERICHINKTSPCAKCHPCNIICGVGGAGGMSDGKLNLNPYIGGNLVRHTKTEEKAYEIITYVDDSLIKFGSPKDVIFDEEKAEKLKEKATKANMRFIPLKQKHIGSDKLGNVIKLFKNYLEQMGVKFLLKTSVEELIIEENKIKGVVLCTGEAIYSKYIILAPGREGQKQFIDFTKKYSIKAKYSYVDIGVRVETKYEVMKELTDINYDPKIHIRTTNYDDLVRIFCTNPRGYVVNENYNGYVGVNGHAFNNKKSENTNFAFLVRIKLTEPLENTFEFGKCIAQIATTIGGGKPVLQRLGDIKRGRRTTKDRMKRNFVIPTLTEVTYGDITMAMPSRIMTDILDGLRQLENLVSGVYSDHTLLYAPEIKYYSMKGEVDESLMSSIENLFLAGDGVGLSRDIINSASTGVMAADGILKKNGKL